MSHWASGFRFQVSWNSVNRSTARQRHEVIKCCYLWRNSDREFSMSPFGCQRLLLAYSATGKFDADTKKVQQDAGFLKYLMFEVSALIA